MLACGYAGRGWNGGLAHLWRRECGAQMPRSSRERGKAAETNSRVGGCPAVFGGRQAKVTKNFVKQPTTQLNVSKAEGHILHVSVRLSEHQKTLQPSWPD